MKKLFTLLLFTILISSCSQHSEANLTQEGFLKWLDIFKQEARQKGISSATLEGAFKDITLNQTVIDLDNKQVERNPDYRFENYKAKAVSQTRIDTGRKLLKENYALLDRVEKEFGVQKEFIVALWGIETNFGTYTGDFYIPRCLATLAYEGRRSEFFKAELMHSMEILDQKHVTPEDFKGSWAGAMGQSQFMPSTFIKHAVDFNKDGRKDIWNTRDDVFASAANYLSSLGWQHNVTWGTRVIVKSNFNKALLGRDKPKRTISEWLKLGVKPLDPKTLPDSSYSASLIDVDGDKGNMKEVYLVYRNFENIMQWNKSTFFATSVGLIADAIKQDKR